jgi:hypothetical protein
MSATARPTAEAKRDAGKGRGHEFQLSVRYYATMKPQRVYPLVVEVPRGRNAVPADAPTGLTVTLRPVIPGAVVVPAELPLEVSRPGAQATFHVTPVAKGRLPDARVVVLYDGRPVQELRTRMAARTQRLTWALLLLTVLLPPLLVHWTSTAPLRGLIADERPVVAKNDDPAQKNDAKAGAGERRTESYLREGMPGEVLDVRVRSGLTNNVPEFPGRDTAARWLGAGLGAGYGFLCAGAPDVRPAFWLGVALFILTFASWVRHRPTRVRRRGSVLLSGAAVSATLRGADTAETLPLSPQTEE